MASEMASYEEQEIFSKPMCLISTDNDGNFVVERNVLNQIQNISVPVSVVSIIGLYRTGKSYLMNRLAGKSEGFPLGNTTKSTTKGIWSWATKHPCQDNLVLLLLDTEGLGDPEKGDAGHDNKIATLATLLCNVLVYNIMNAAFNQDAIEKLTFVSEITQRIRSKGSIDGIQNRSPVDFFLPTFVLCLRDFCLDIEGISPDELLENWLKLQPEETDKQKAFNRPRESVRKYFPTRKCFTFDRPGDTMCMNLLEEMPLEKLSKTFQDDTEKFLQYIYNQPPKVLLHSKPFTGEMFTLLVEFYVKTIGEGSVLDVDDAVTAVSNAENNRLAKEVVKIFRNRLARVQLPQLKTKELDQMYLQYKTDMLCLFRRQAMFGSEAFEERIISEIDTLWKTKYEENLKAVKKHCHNKFLAIYSTVVGNPKEYHKPDGYSAYKKQLEKVKSDYKTETMEIDKQTSQEILFGFMDKETRTENKILMADKQLTTEERQRELDQITKQLEEQKAYMQMYKHNMNEEILEYKKDKDAMRGLFLEQTRLREEIESMKSEKKPKNDTCSIL